MFSLFSRSMCCSVRDKDGRGRGLGMGLDAQNFVVGEVEVPLEQPSMLAFAPLWQSNAVCVRRLALASEQAVNVYNLSGYLSGCPSGAEGGLQPERSLVMEEGQSITSMLFRDEDSSRHLLVAFGPSGGSAPAGSASSSSAAAGRYCVRVWGCESESGQSSESCWRPDHGYIASLEDHSAPVVRLAVSSTYLLTADSMGECRVWQKARNFQLRAVARLHQSGGVLDLAVDRLFAYSVGGQDLAIRVWSMPDLKQVLTISADTVECVLSPLGAPAPEAPTAPPASCRLSQLTAVRRPTSRWSGAQGSTRNSGTPRGMLFVAGTVADAQDGGTVTCAGAGVLMEWALGTTPVCQSAQIAHESRIVALAYGPYDNGPLVTADAWGVFRIWDYTPRLWCSQQVATGDIAKPTAVALAVDPLHRALYSIVGDKRISVWRQNGPGIAPSDAAAA